jgi:aspartate aminotransferase
MNTIAQRVNQINEPQTIAMAKKARELIAQGIDVISLSLGEPDFETPQHIKEAAIAAIQNNFSYYTPVAGIPELREAISNKLKNENNLNYEANQIVVSTGAKHALMNTIMALVNEGDEVIIPTPYWVSYSEMVKLMGGVPVFIDAPLSQHYKITAQQLAQAVTAKTKAFLFSSPCNPTGSVYTLKELESLCEVFRQHKHIMVISDEIYEYINFEGKHHSIGSLDGMVDRTITINGLSKGFAMTGWRLGYLAAPLAIAQACEKIQAQYTSATSSITQKAAVAAITGNRDACILMTQAFKRRKELLQKGLGEITGMVCNEPTGAFYFFPDISYFFGKKNTHYTINNATDLCLYLLNEAHVSLVSGETFGNPNCIRISYAASDEKLVQAIARLKVALTQLK